jgi:hypothetical protein
LLDTPHAAKIPRNTLLPPLSPCLRLADPEDSGNRSPVPAVSYGARSSPDAVPEERSQRTNCLGAENKLVFAVVVNQIFNQGKLALVGDFMANGVPLGRDGYRPWTRISARPSGPDA